MTRSPNNDEREAKEKGAIDMLLNILKEKLMAELPRKMCKDYGNGTLVRELKVCRTFKS